MLGSGSIIMLHELKAKGKSIRAIARETGLSRNTVRKYLRAQGIPERKPHPKRGSKLNPYKDTIQELMNLGIFNWSFLLCTIFLILVTYLLQYFPSIEVPKRIF